MPDRESGTSAVLRVALPWNWYARIMKFEVSAPSLALFDQMRYGQSILTVAWRKPSVVRNETMVPTSVPSPRASGCVVMARPPRLLEHMALAAMLPPMLAGTLQIEPSRHQSSTESHL